MAYDVLDNLTKVTQGSQVRKFEYSLGRLMRACNPETGTANCAASTLPLTAGLESYTYDANGNVASKMDARSITTTFGTYDGLNRPPSKSYSDGTPGVTYKYDQDWKGALSAVSVGSSSSKHATSYTHDSLGRVASSTQTVGGVQAGPFVYTLSLADQLTAIQYPSGRKFNFGLDTGARLTSLTDAFSSKIYASGFGYNADSSVSTLTLGNNLIEKYSYNDRLQFTNLAVGPATGTGLLNLAFYPCSGPPLATACATGNTGNIQAQEITLPVSIGSTVTTKRTVSYGYDPLNRLNAFTDGASQLNLANQSYFDGPVQGYKYAGSHNWYVDTNQDTGFALSSFTPRQPTNFDANNRLFVQNPTYDAAGAQTLIGGRTNVYDAENRVTTSKLTASVGFSYDGLGQRVQKINCPNGDNPCTASATGAAVTTFLYDASGNLAVESGPPLGVAGNGVAMCGTPTCYLSVDQVGSTRLITDSNGVVQHRYDYLPFGEEIPVVPANADPNSVNNHPSWRTVSMGYSMGPDGFAIKYTGQYRDPETGMDYFNARYYSPAQGRFVSPDPGNAGATVGDPGTWNGYGYVGGNPVNVTDPSGLGFWSDFAVFFASLFGGGGISSFGVNDGPWNEQVPGVSTGRGTLGGGGVNTGGVFGGGQIGPGVFSFAQADLISQDALTWALESTWLFQAVGQIPGSVSSSNPCGHIDAKTLDYTTPRWYQSEQRTVSPKTHILEGHMLPTNDPRNSFYVSGSSTVGLAGQLLTWINIVDWNRMTFTKGTVTSQQRRTRNYKYDYTIPPPLNGRVPGPGGFLTWQGIGMDPSGQWRTKNSLVIDNTCKGVVTSYPSR